MTKKKKAKKLKVRCIMEALMSQTNTSTSAPSNLSLCRWRRFQYCQKAEKIKTKKKEQKNKEIYT